MSWALLAIILIVVGCVMYVAWGLIMLPLPNDPDYKREPKS